MKRIIVKSKVKSACVSSRFTALPKKDSRFDRTFKGYEQPLYVKDRIERGDLIKLIRIHVPDCQGLYTMSINNLKDIAMSIPKCQVMRMLYAA